MSGEANILSRRLSASYPRRAGAWANARAVSTYCSALNVISSFSPRADNWLSLTRERWSPHRLLLNIRYGEGLPVEVAVQTCKEVPNVVGWKMTYNYTGFRNVSRALRRLDRHVGILGAPAVNFHENLANDCFDGTVSGSWNYSPEPMLDHILAWRRGDWKEALRIWQNGLAELQEYVYSDFARLHIKYKTGTWLRGFISNPYMRPPLPKPRRAGVETLRTLLKNCGMGVINDAAVKKVMDVLPL